LAAELLETASAAAVEIDAQSSAKLSSGQAEELTRLREQYSSLLEEATYHKNHAQQLERENRRLADQHKYSRKSKKQLAAKEQSQSQTPAPSQGRPQQQAPPQANRLAPSSNAPPQAAPAPYQQPAPCRLSKEELYKKTNGCIKEYLSIQDMKEVQAGLREWNHIEATTIFIDQLIMVGVETSRQGQALIQRLLFQLIGRPDGLPSDVFCARMDILFGQLADLRHDIPTLHTSLGEFIAAASAADANVVKVVTNLCHPALIACLGTLGCELTVHVFSTTKVKSPATVMPLYRVLGLDLALLLPESRRADGTLEDICTRAGVPELLQERFR